MQMPPNKAKRYIQLVCECIHIWQIKMMPAKSDRLTKNRFIFL